MIGKFKKSLILTILSFVFVFSFFPFEKAMAGTSDNVSGWAWSENIGWISFNGMNCDPDCVTGGTCTSDGVGFPNGCPAAGSTYPDYGVKVDLAGTRDLSGYAWSENIGWISFEPISVSGCPTGGICQANLSALNELSGWARACSVFQLGCDGALDPNAGGWDGWIHFKGSNYGVTFNPADDEFKNWAWGGDNTDPNKAVIGWISFNRENCDTNDSGAIDAGDSGPIGCPAIGTLIPDYKVKMVAGSVAKPINLTLDADNPADYCFNTVHPPIRLRWNSVNQVSYDIQIDDQNNFLSPEITDSGGSSQSYAPSSANNVLAYGATYYWRVRITDSSGNTSSWESSQFTTLSWPYPDPVFVNDPIKPAPNESVLFTADPNSFKNPVTVSDKWTWTFGDGSPAVDRIRAQNTISHTYTFIASGGYVVTLKATANIDGNDKVCSRSKNISILFSPPTWIETKPPSQ